MAPAGTGKGTDSPARVTLVFEVATESARCHCRRGAPPHGAFDAGSSSHPRQSRRGPRALQAPHHEGARASGPEPLPVARGAVPHRAARARAVSPRLSGANLEPIRGCAEPHPRTRARRPTARLEGLDAARRIRERRLRAGAEGTSRRRFDALPSSATPDAARTQATRVSAAERRRGSSYITRWPSRRAANIGSTTSRCTTAPTTPSPQTPADRLYGGAGCTVGASGCGAGCFFAPSGYSVRLSARRFTLGTPSPVTGSHSDLDR